MFSKGNIIEEGVRPNNRYLEFVREVVIFNYYLCFAYPIEEVRHHYLL